MEVNFRFVVSNFFNVKMKFSKILNERKPNLSFCLQRMESRTEIFTKQSTVKFQSVSCLLKNNTPSSLIL